MCSSYQSTDFFANSVPVPVPVGNDFFRQYWLETVVAPELSPSYSEKSRFTFIPLKTIPTSDLPQLLHNPETYFAEKWSDITLDGLVISHKQSQYDTSNPLVFWAAWPLNFAEAVSQE